MCSCWTVSRQFLITWGYSFEITQSTNTDDCVILKDKVNSITILNFYKVLENSSWFCLYRLRARKRILLLAVNVNSQNLNYMLFTCLKFMTQWLFRSRIWRRGKLRNRSPRVSATWIQKMAFMQFTTVKLVLYMVNESECL